MGKDPDAIRAEIARTREGMAGTVDALAYKSDVKERTKDKVRHVASKPKDAILSIRENIMGTVQEHSDAPAQVVGTAKKTARRAGGAIQENPVGLAIGGLALGFVAGLVLPSTRVENQKLGPMADQLKDTAKEQGQELIDRGKDVAQSAMEAAKETAQEGDTEARTPVGTAPSLN
ncbi:MAG: hypothetical protein JWO69_691 [Thermoleophilia bacterium]|jgi:ElaB/YqjD/DUF883 family membrane-anchored ribosome-binding protein|nr:hypothetical protein [Thermoleophilia bacterium]